MVVDNSPSGRKSTENERKNPSGVTDGPAQVPMAENESGVRPQGSNLEAGERKLAHGLLIRVRLAITSQKTIIAANNTIGAGKRQVGRVPIAFQEGWNVASIPSRLLGIQDGANRRRRMSGWGGVWSSRSCVEGRKSNGQEECHEQG